MRHVLLLFAVFLASLPSSAVALTPKQEAERSRLHDEMAELAARNAWKGVDRQYAKLVDEELEPGVEEHLLGAQASTNLGDMLAAVERLERAVAALPEGSSEAEVAAGVVEAHGTAKTTLEGILRAYGKVEIKVGNARLPGLIRFDLPFAAQERETIQRAREVILADRTYKGLLPIGEYMIDGDKFQVLPSDVWQSFVVD